MISDWDHHVNNGAYSTLKGVAERGGGVGSLQIPSLCQTRTRIAPSGLTLYKTHTLCETLPVPT